MAIAKDPTDLRRKRRSIRLQGYDYSQAGTYYITICTRDRQCLFGNVVDGQMQLNKVGQMVQAVWNGLPQFYEGIELDAFIIMPNHVHGVIVLRAGVGANYESPLPSGSVRIANRRRMLLSKVIGRFKMVSAKQINDVRRSRGSSVWQRNYYEHIVRDDESLERIRQYIIDNPAQWEIDRENPAVTPSQKRNAG